MKYVKFSKVRNCEFYFSIHVDIVFKNYDCTMPKSDSIQSKNEENDGFET